MKDGWESAGKGLVEGMLQVEGRGQAWVQKWVLYIWRRAVNGTLRPWGGGLEGECLWGLQWGGEEVWAGPDASREHSAPVRPWDAFEGPAAPPQAWPPCTLSAWVGAFPGLKADTAWPTGAGR